MSTCLVFTKALNRSNPLTLSGYFDCVSTLITSCVAICDSSTAWRSRISSSDAREFRLSLGNAGIRQAQALSRAEMPSFPPPSAAVSCNQLLAQFEQLLLVSLHLRLSLRNGGRQMRSTLCSVVSVAAVWPAALCATSENALTTKEAGTRRQTPMSLAQKSALRRCALPVAYFELILMTSAYLASWRIGISR
jgi:hypothetical protein